MNQRNYTSTVRQQRCRTAARLRSSLANALLVLILTGCANLPSEFVEASRELAYRQLLAGKVGDEAADEIMALARLDLHNEASLFQVVRLNERLIYESDRLLSEGVASVVDVFQEKVKAEGRYVAAFEQLQAARQSSEILDAHSGIESEVDGETQDAAIEAILTELEAAVADGYRFPDALQRRLRGAYTQFLLGLAYQIEAYETAGIVKELASRESFAEAMAAGETPPAAELLSFVKSVFVWAGNTLESIDLFFKLERASSVTGLVEAEERLSGSSITDRATAQQPALLLSYQERRQLQSERVRMRRFASQLDIGLPQFDCRHQPELGNRQSREEVQRLLNEWGYHVGEVDGDIGLRSRQQIRAFQEAEGLVVDGRATSGLLLALRGELRRNSSGADEAVHSAMQSFLGGLMGVDSEEREPLAAHRQVARDPELCVKREPELTAAEKIQEAQELLRQLGHPQISVNGSKDAAMSQALLQFQTAHQLEAEGRLTPATLSALRLTRTITSENVEDDGEDKRKKQDPFALFGAKLREAIQKRLEERE